jgi:hypothetical protein
VQVQLCQDCQRPTRTLHRKRIRWARWRPQFHCAPRGTALRSQALRPQVSRQEMRQTEAVSARSRTALRPPRGSPHAWLKSMAGRGRCRGGASGASSSSSAWSFTQANSNGTITHHTSGFSPKSPSSTARALSPDAIQISLNLSRRPT